jgi:hypothetical protein
MLDTEYIILNVTSALNYDNGSTNSIAYPEFLNVITIDFFVTYISHNTGLIVAMEYALCFCSQTYNSSMTGGQTLTTIISTWNTITSVPGGEAYGWDRWVVIEGPVVFNMSLNVIDNMMAASQEIFQGVEWVDHYTPISDANDKVSISAQAIAAVLAQRGNESAAMDVFMNNLAISLTNRSVTPSKAIPLSANS